jgi:hypothetical protein
VLLRNTSALCRGLEEEMAIYHCSIKPISRGAGQSIVAAAAYRHACKLEDSRTGEVYDFTRKRGVVFSEIYSPDHAHASWVQNREQLWNHAEAVEKRKDARLGREILFALPLELTEHQRKELIGTMAKSLAKRYGSVVDVAVHSPSRYGDERNFHAHVLLSSRRIGQDGFGEKVHELDDRKRGPMEISFIRSEWARLANQALKQAEQEASIDHRTLKAQGIDREPTIHLGVSASAMERRGIQTVRGSINRRIRERQKNREELAELEREEKEVQRQKRDREAAENLRPQLESWAVVAHGLFAGDAGVMFAQTTYPTRQCEGLLDFMRSLNLVDDNKKVQPETMKSVLQSGDFWVEDAKMFCLMKTEQGQRNVSFSEIHEMGKCVSVFAAMFRAEQEREKKEREEQEAIEQERRDKQRIQAWKQLANPQYTEDEKQCLACYERLGHYERNDIAGCLSKATRKQSLCIDELDHAKSIAQWCDKEISRLQEKLEGLGFLGRLFSRSRLQEELEGVERKRSYTLKQIEEKSKELKDDTETIRFYLSAQKSPGIIRRRTAEAQERQTKALTPELEASLSRQRQRDEAENARKEQEREKDRQQKRQQEREHGWGR